MTWWQRVLARVAHTGLDLGNWIMDRGFETLEWVGDDTYDVGPDEVESLQHRLKRETSERRILAAIHDCDCEHGPDCTFFRVLVDEGEHNTHAADPRAGEGR